MPTPASWTAASQRILDHEQGRETMADNAVSDPVAATPVESTCEWCGSPIRADTVWTDETNGSGDFCPEGKAVGYGGTSPHKPVAATPQPDPAGLRAALDGLLKSLDKYEAGWMTSRGGYGEVAERKAEARAALAAADSEGRQPDAVVD